MIDAMLTAGCAMALLLGFVSGLFCLVGGISNTIEGNLRGFIAVALGLVLWWASLSLLIYTSPVIK